MPHFREGFLGTLALTASSALLALVLGIIMAGFRVVPDSAAARLRHGLGHAAAQHPADAALPSPCFVVPQIFFPGSSLRSAFAMLALGCYTSAFVCEAVRSGINTVPLGQAEAARSLGMTFAQTLRLIVLPQATRTVIPPMSSIFIALTKNSAIAGAFSDTELFSVSKLLNDKGYAIGWIFLWIALATSSSPSPSAVLFRLLESRLEVAR